MIKVTFLCFAGKVQIDHILFNGPTISELNKLLFLVYCK